MAYTQTDLKALEAALANGEKRVSIGDKSIEYRSIDELKAAIEVVKRDLLAQAVSAGRSPAAVRQIRLTTQKGT